MNLIMQYIRIILLQGRLCSGLMVEAAGSSGSIRRTNGIADGIRLVIVFLLAGLILLMRIQPGIMVSNVPPKQLAIQVTFN